MHFGRVLAATALLSVTTLPLVAAGHARRGVTSIHLLRKRASHGSTRAVGQRTIDDSRASEIQSALAGAGYLAGEPSGHWDAETESAMRRYQADHGWQTHLTPDSRAIIKLGLGPKQASLDGSTPLGGASAASGSEMALSSTR